MSEDWIARSIGAALTGLRRLRGRKASEVAGRLQVSQNMYTRYEQGVSGMPAERLAQSLALLDCTEEELAGLVERYQALLMRIPPEETAPPLAPTPAERRYIRKVGGALRQDVEAKLERLTGEAHITEARQQAEKDVRLLLACPLAERRVLVERWPGFQSWAMVERLSWESEREAANDPDAALELAHLARSAAEKMAPGPERERACGYAWGYVGNALRVKNDHDDSGKAYARSWQQWKAGAAAELPLEEWRLWDLEGSLFLDMRQLDRALENLQQALAKAPEEWLGRILLKRSNSWSEKGEHEKALADLDEAAPRIDETWSPRNVLVLQFNRADSLCRLGRHEGASRLLPEVRSRVNKLGNELDLVRTLWLEGKVAVGLGRVDEGLAALVQVEAELRHREMAFDGALVNLDIAEIELAQGKTASAKQRAAGMWWIFRGKGVHREALVALQMFCEAAKQEEATEELARRVKAFLEKARYDLALRFER